MGRRIKNMIPEDDPRVSQIGHPAPPWLVNYADLMTELVCFFVILYALSAALNKNVQNAAQQVKEMMDSGQMSGRVEINKEGLKISLEEQGRIPFFKSGSAELTDNMKDKLEKILPILKNLAKENEIVVEGHTDNIPIHTEDYDSNWELSTARATEVVKYFVSRGMPPTRVAAIGYGEYRPVAPNDTPENRRKNRRVVFFVKTGVSKFKPVESRKKKKHG